MSGLLITFEGIDFSGKSSQLHLLGDYLAGRGHEVLYLREPGGTAISESIRDILLDNANSSMAAEAELLLYAAARAQVVAERILPFIRAGGIVLCDRYADSTTAYQGYGRGLDLAFVESLNNFATRNRKPDMTVLIDIQPELAIKRRKTGDTLDRMENQTLEFHQKVRSGYLTIAQSQPERCYVIAGTQDIGSIHKQIVTYIKSKFHI